MKRYPIVVRLGCDATAVATPDSKSTIGWCLVVIEREYSDEGSPYEVYLDIYVEVDAGVLALFGTMAAQDADS